MRKKTGKVVSYGKEERNKMVCYGNEIRKMVSYGNEEYYGVESSRKPLITTHPLLLSLGRETLAASRHFLFVTSLYSVPLMSLTIQPRHINCSTRRTIIPDGLTANPCAASCRPQYRALFVR
jgi:hypothetical protein